MNEWIYDIEIFKNFFCCTFSSEKEVIIIEISERKQQFKEFKKLYQKLCDRKDYVIGFNSINYDNLICNFMMELIDSGDYIDYLDFCQQVKDFSDLIIYGQKVQQVKFIKAETKDIQLKLKFELEELELEIRESKFKMSEFEWFEKIKPYRWIHKWVDIDLLLYWSKNIRIVSQLSLKSIACQLNYSVIQELPIPHDSFVKLEDIPNIIEYNSVHDIGVTKLLFKKLSQEVNLRKMVCEDYGLKAMSWDAPKIASEILLQDYCKRKYNNTGWEIMQQIRNTKHEKESFIIGEHLPMINFKTELFQNMFEVCQNSTDTFSYSFIVPFEKQHLKIILGQGGAHNSFEDKVFKATDTLEIITSDVTALYPTLLENLQVFKYPEVQIKYSEIKKERVETIKPTLQKVKKTNNRKQIEEWEIKDAFYKLKLNSVSGLLDSKYNWLYNNIPINILRIYGQMMLCRLVEECWINHITVISANTDGLEILIEKNKKDLYLSIIEEIEKEFNVKFEHENYKAIYYKNVNNYLAITTTDKVKLKGSTFTTEPLIGKSNDFMAISKVLKEYFLNGIKPETILNKENWSKYLTPFDFCASFKISKKYIVYWNSLPQQQLNRFYVSKKGSYLYKQKRGKYTMENVLKGFSIVLMNRYDSSKIDYDFNFNYYLNKVNEIINDLEPKQLTLF